jgi:DNA invertase Pin-like site-specific DNA recombinase
MKIATYARVSSALQAEANSTDSQMLVINRWLAAEGVDPATVQHFEDIAVSGKSMNRPGWNKMMAAVKAREVDTIVLYDLSRAGRTLIGLLEWVADMNKKGVRVVFVKESIDITTAMGEMMIAMMGAVAQFQRKELARRVSDGIRAKIAGGYQWKADARKLDDEGYAALLRRYNLGERMADLVEESGISRVTLRKHWKRLEAENEL